SLDRRRRHGGRHGNGLSFPRCGTAQWRATAHRHGDEHLARAEPRLAQLNSCLTVPLALPKSIWPANFSRSAAITLPMSLIPAAPVSAMTERIAASISD